MHYRTVDGDRLDCICAKRYGHLRGTVEFVLSQNPGLSDQSGVLPSGLLIELPEMSSPEVVPLKAVSLWS